VFIIDALAFHRSISWFVYVSLYFDRKAKQSKGKEIGYLFRRGLKQQQQLKQTTSRRRRRLCLCVAQMLDLSLGSQPVWLK